MLVCCHQGLFFRVHLVGRRNNFSYHFEVEKIALVFIYLTWFSTSLLRSTSCVYFFCNVHPIILKLAYFNPHKLPLVGEQLQEPHFHGSLSTVRPHRWDDDVTIHWSDRSMPISLFLSFFFLLSLLIYFLFFLLSVKLALVISIQFSRGN